MYSPFLDLANHRNNPQVWRVSTRLPMFFKSCIMAAGAEGHRQSCHAGDLPRAQKRAWPQPRCWCCKKERQDKGTRVRRSPALLLQREEAASRQKKCVCVWLGGRGRWRKAHGRHLTFSVVNSSYSITLHAPTYLIWWLPMKPSYINKNLTSFSVL